jgi:hypothetical protein
VNGTISRLRHLGARPTSGSLGYTLAAVACGTQNPRAVGTCATRISYQHGASVTITENVSTNDAVTAITLSGRARGGGA